MISVMKKSRVYGVNLILFVMMVFVCLNCVSAVRINEIELNPAGEDNGNEWLELYSEQEIDLTGWRIENVKGKNLSLDFSFSGYKIVMTAYQFLTNEKQKLVLYNAEGNKIQETDEISDTKNDERSWQYCSDWVFTEASKGKENKCEEETTEEPEEEAQEETQETAEESEENGTTKEENKINKIEESSKNIGVEDTVEKSSVINLGNRQTNENSDKTLVLYESSFEKIKKYAIYIFSLILLIIIFILIRKKV